MHRPAVPVVLAVVLSAAAARAAQPTAGGTAGTGPPMELLDGDAAEVASGQPGRVGR